MVVKDFVSVRTGVAVAAGTVSAGAGVFSVVAVLGGTGDEVSVGDAVWVAMGEGVGPVASGVLLASGT